MTERLYGTYNVTALDSDGDPITTSTVEETGAFTIEDIASLSVHGVDAIEVDPLKIEIQEDGEVLHWIETDGESHE